MTDENDFTTPIKRPTGGDYYKHDRNWDMKYVPEGQQTRNITLTRGGYMQIKHVPGEEDGPWNDDGPRGPQAA